MTYVSSGVKVDTDGKFEWCKTKKALRETLASAPDKILVVTFGLGGHSPVAPGDMVAGTRYQVAGPDPERRRNWYATLENRDGVLFLDDKEVKVKA